VSRVTLLGYLEAETKNLRQAGLMRPELTFPVPPGRIIRVGDRDLVSFASSDYLGLSAQPELKQAAAEAIERWGVGVASPRAAVGSIALHAELEATIAKLLGAEQALVYASGHHANTGLFESLLDDRDFVFCDEMARPSLADGIRLSRARGYVYRSNDMAHLEDRLKRSRAARFRVIATDGVFPVTQKIADLAAIHALAAKYHATVVVDDSEGLGVLGKDGEGTHGHLGLGTGPHVVTGSFGHALGGGAGGFIAGPSTIVTWLRHKSRPHLASTALSPAAAAAALKALELLGTARRLRGKLTQNLQALEKAMTKDAGVVPNVTHPAVSVRVRNAISAQRLTDWLYRQGLFVIGYCHPVVPEGDARIGLRVTALHEPSDLESLAKALGEGMKELRVPL
jgi:glycine C-acetyltransferase